MKRKTNLYRSFCSLINIEWKSMRCAQKKKTKATLQWNGWGHARLCSNRTSWWWPSWLVMRQRLIISALYVRSSCMKTKTRPAHTICLHSRRNSREFTRHTSANIFTHAQEGRRDLPLKGFYPRGISFGGKNIKSDTFWRHLVYSLLVIDRFIRLKEEWTNHKSHSVFE